MPNVGNHHVLVSDFIHCCGAKILYSFYTTPPIDANEYYQAYYQKATEEKLKKHNETYTESSEEYKKRLTKEIQAKINSLKGEKSYFIAITNEDEKKAGVNDILEELGFEVVVGETRNPTGTSITMWVYHLLPKTKKNTSSMLAPKKV